MSGKYTINQCDDAIAALKKAGYKRSEFSVTIKKRTWTDRETGRRMTEYLDPRILIWVPLQLQYERLNACLEAGINAAVWIIKGKVGYPMYTYAYGERGKLELIDTRLGIPAIARLTTHAQWDNQYPINL